MATNGKAASATAGALQLSNLIKAYAMSAPWQIRLWLVREATTISGFMAISFQLLRKRRRDRSSAGWLHRESAGCTESLMQPDFLWAIDHNTQYM